MNDQLLQVVNEVRANKQLVTLGKMHPDQRLREDLGFESLDLAELTVRIEERFGVDVFADGLVHTVGEIAAKIEASPRA
jgi:acyl carrier protein